MNTSEWIEKLQKMPKGDTERAYIICFMLDLEVNEIPLFCLLDFFDAVKINHGTAVFSSNVQPQVIFEYFFKYYEFSSNSNIEQKDKILEVQSKSNDKLYMAELVKNHFAFILGYPLKPEWFGFYKMFNSENGSIPKGSFY